MGEKSVTWTFYFGFSCQVFSYKCVNKIGFSLEPLDHLLPLNQRLTFLNILLFCTLLFVMADASTRLLPSCFCEVYVNF